MVSALAFQINSLSAGRCGYMTLRSFSGAGAFSAAGVSSAREASTGTGATGTVGSGICGIAGSGKEDAVGSGKALSPPARSGKPSEKSTLSAENGEPHASQRSPFSCWLLQKRQVFIAYPWDQPIVRRWCTFLPFLRNASPLLKSFSVSM